MAAHEAEIVRALRLLEGRWKLTILYHLLDGKPKRYTELSREIYGIAPKVLTDQLRQMDMDGLVFRKKTSKPMRVEYEINPWTRKFFPESKQLEEWASRKPLLKRALTRSPK
jgi:DNA-binding HxlR family transcriptional regulator